MSSQAIRRELVWRAVAVVILGAACVWAVVRTSWVVAGITGFLALFTLSSLALALYARKRGLLK